MSLEIRESNEQWGLTSPEGVKGIPAAKGCPAFVQILLMTLTAMRGDQRHRAGQECRASTVTL
jgi:hypothetical protein